MLSKLRRKPWRGKLLRRQCCNIRRRRRMPLLSRRMMIWDSLLLRMLSSKLRALHNGRISREREIGRVGMPREGSSR